MNAPESGTSENPRVLYIAYWGALEPLGQSLVVPAVERLARRRAYLITFEKPTDLARSNADLATRARLRDAGIRWLPLRYHKDPKIPATAFDIANGCLRGLVQRLRGRIDVIHGRTFIGGLIGQTLSRLLGVPWIITTRGFTPTNR